MYIRRARAIAFPVGACAASCTYTAMRLKSLQQESTSVKRPKNHGTEAMDNSRSHSDSTCKLEEDRYQRSATVW